MLHGTSLLLIHFKYSGVYESIPNSLNYPFSPSFPSATVGFFSKSVNLLLFFKQIHLYRFFLDSTYKGCHTIFLLLCQSWQFLKEKKRRGKNLSEPPTVSSDVVFPEWSACRLLSRGQSRGWVLGIESSSFFFNCLILHSSFYLGKEQVIQDSISQELG